MKLNRCSFCLLALLSGFLPFQGLRAESLTLEFMGGTAFNLPTPLTVHQDGFPDIKTSADYDTKPFGPYAPYYAWRAGLWDGDEAWEMEQIHHRLFLTNPPPEIQYFAIHFGYNYFFFGHAWKKGGLIYRLGIGPIVSNPESSVRGQVKQEVGTGIFDAGYYFSGLGIRAGLGKNFYISNNAFIVAETELTAGWAWWVPIAGGYADVPNIALHGHLGVGYDF